MCGVIGCTILNFSESDVPLVEGLFRETMIRGKHATGVSYVKGGVVVTHTQPLPADEFIKQQNILDWKNEDGNLYFVGHIRYSTSDLRFNQPISNPDVAVSHNGVISQEPPEQWESMYGLKTTTANDSELILRAIENGDNPLEKFKESSMAVCSIQKNKVLNGYRNDLRPMYISYSDRMVVFTSTVNIPLRAGFKGTTKKTDMYSVYEVKSDLTTKIEHIYNESEDLQ